MAQTQPQTFPVPNRTWPVGRTFVTSQNGINPPDGQWQVSLSPSNVGAGTDWATGTAGRRFHVAVEVSEDAGATWVDLNGGNDFLTARYGKGGSPNPPVQNLSIDVPRTMIVRVAVDVLDAPVTCGLSATVAANP